MVQNVKVYVLSHGGWLPEILFLFEYLSPCLTQTRFLPTADWADDSQNDFAVVYHPTLDALIHFLPSDADVSKRDQLLNNLSDPAMIDTNLKSFSPGVYIAIGADRATSGHQCGSTQYDPTHQLPLEAFYDASYGFISGSSGSGGPSDGLLAFPLDHSKSQEEITIYWAVAETYEKARNLLEYARSVTAGAHLSATENWWKDWIKDMRLPATDNPDQIALSKRAMMTVRTGADRASGAIVASVSTQPPYAEDWPRDGALNNYALDVAGFHDMVTQHNLFYARVQRKVDGADTFGLGPISPAGTWAMNYYGSGVPGGILDFESDLNALGLWTLWTHARFLTDATERKDYLDEVYPAIRLAAEALRNCRDAQTGLQCPSYEVDFTAPIQGLGGAVTVYMALNSAADASEEMGQDSDLRKGWRDRAGELKEAILNNFWDPNEQAFQGFDNFGLSWLIWPAKLLPPDDPRIKSHARYLMNRITPVIRKEVAGGGYDSLATLALSTIWTKPGPDRDALKEAIDVLTLEVPTPGTRHYGEVYVIDDFNGDGEKEFQNRVAIPDLWEASSNYLSLMAFYNPEEFEPWKVGLQGGGGCGCKQFGSSSPDPVALRRIILSAAFLVFVVVLVWKGAKRGKRKK